MIKELLSADSPISSMRLMSLTCVMSAVLIAIVGIYLGKDMMGLATLCSAFLAPAFAGKAVQKHIETRTP